MRPALRCETMGYLIYSYREILLRYGCLEGGEVVLEFAMHAVRSTDITAQKRRSRSGVSLSRITSCTPSFHGDALVASISLFYRSSQRFRDDHEDVNIYDRGSLLATVANRSTLRAYYTPMHLRYSS
jgi:hypothetical protein